MAYLRAGQYRSAKAANEELLCIPRWGGGAWLQRVLIESRMDDGPVVCFDSSRECNARPEPVRRAELRDWIDVHSGRCYPH